MFGASACDVCQLGFLGFCSDVFFPSLYTRRLCNNVDSVAFCIINVFACDIASRVFRVLTEFLLVMQVQPAASQEEALLTSVYNLEIPLETVCTP